jgi:hypothetical protein
MMRQLLCTAIVVSVTLVTQTRQCQAAGNVTAIQLGDTLFLLGDSQANTLNIISESDGDVFIKGKRSENPDTNPTSTINGENAVQLFSGVLDVVALTGAGGDWVEFHGGFPGDLFIDTSRNNDRIVVFVGGGAEIAGNLFITTGSGGDGIEFESVSVAGSAEIETGSGRDRIFFSFFKNFSGGLTVDTGVQDDAVRFVETVSGGFIIMNVGMTFQINLGVGKDTLQLPTQGDQVLVDGDATLSGDQGIDQLISESGINVAGDLQILDFE